MDIPWDPSSFPFFFSKFFVKDWVFKPCKFSSNRVISVKFDGAKRGERENENEEPYSTARSPQSSSNFFFLLFIHILFLFGRAFNFDGRILILPPLVL